MEEIGGATKRKKEIILLQSSFSKVNELFFIREKDVTKVIKKQVE